MTPHVNALEGYGISHPHCNPHLRQIRCRIFRYGGYLNSSRKNVAVDSVNDLCVPFTEHFEQPASIVQCVNGVTLVRRFNRIFKPVGDAWIC